MSKTLTIRLDDDGSVYRGDKLIATVDGDDITFKHHAYKKHRDEIEYLTRGDYTESPEPVDIGLEPIQSDPVTPIELFKMGNGGFLGEENPPVVLWRKDNWSLESFQAKYAHQEELLRNNFEKEGYEFTIQF